MPRQGDRPSADLDTSAFIAMVRQFLYDRRRSQPGRPRMTRRDVAEAIGIKPSALTKLLSSPNRRPTPETVVGVARLLGTSVWSVAVAAGYPFNSPQAPDEADERYLRLIQSDSGIRAVLEKYYHEVSPEKREALIELAIAMLNRRPNHEP